MALFATEPIESFKHENLSTIEITLVVVSAKRFILNLIFIFVKLLLRPVSETCHTINWS